MPSDKAPGLRWVISATLFGTNCSAPSLPQNLLPSALGLATLDPPRASLLCERPGSRVGDCCPSYRGSSPLASSPLPACLKMLIWGAEGDLGWGEVWVTNAHHHRCPFPGQSHCEGGEQFIEWKGAPSPKADWGCAGPGWQAQGLYRRCRERHGQSLWQGQLRHPPFCSSPTPHKGLALGQAEGSAGGRGGGAVSSQELQAFLNLKGRGVQ